MVAKVLLVNTNNTNILNFNNSLKEYFCVTIAITSHEDVLRVVVGHNIDVVVIELPEKLSKTFLDFFAIFRQLCGIIPIIGCVKTNANISLYEYQGLEIEDIVYDDIPVENLIKKINILMKLKNMFDEDLMGNFSIKKINQKKVIAIFYDNLNFLSEAFIENTNIIKTNKWPLIIDDNDADLFMINIEHASAYNVSANIYLKKKNKKKPIIFTYDKNTKEKASKAINCEIGCTDIINTVHDSIIISARLNAFIKYKKLYEQYTEKLKNSIYFAAIDSITEVYNRAFFDNYIANNVFTKYAILMIDIDNFKQINDSHGHSFADLVLKHIASIIKTQIRTYDVIARYGGDEFIIIINNVEHNEAYTVAQRMQVGLENNKLNAVQITTSIGICCVSITDEITVKKAIAIADDFMYMAKKTQGNSIKTC